MASTFPTNQAIVVGGGLGGAPELVVSTFAAFYQVAIQRCWLKCIFFGPTGKIIGQQS